MANVTLGPPPLAACTGNSTSEADSGAGVPSFWVGVIAAIVGSMVLAVGMNVQRLAHLRLQRRRSTANFLFDRTWQIGLAIFIVGNFGDAVALAFAPQSVVTPLGCFSLVANVISAKLILQEQIGPQTAVGRCGGFDGWMPCAHPREPAPAKRRGAPHAPVGSSSVACSRS